MVEPDLTPLWWAFVLLILIVYAFIRDYRETEYPDEAQTRRTPWPPASMGTSYYDDEEEEEKKETQAQSTLSILDKEIQIQHKTCP